MLGTKSNADLLLSEKPSIDPSNENGWQYCYLLMFFTSSYHQKESIE